jgi:hypothetical protein
LAVLNDAAAARYLRWWAGAVVGLTLGVLALAVAADPYYVFGSPTWAGFNRVKPKADAKGLMAKTYQLPRICALTLLLGNSRMQNGFDPDSPSWPAAMRPVFNAGLAGTGPEVAWRMLQLAQRTCPPRLVIVAADFPDALVAPDQGGLPRAASAAGWWDRVADAAVASLTLDGFVDSVLTLAGQTDPYSTDMTPAGLNPLRDYVGITRQQGYYRLFAQKLEIYGGQLHAARQPVLDPAHNIALRVLAQIVADARAGGARVVVLINPYHESYFDLLRRTGRWETFLAWKAALATLVGGQTDPENAGVRLFDFSTLDLVREPIPAPGDLRTEMRYYWESGHYKRSLGDVMIREIFSTTNATK